MIFYCLHNRLTLYGKLLCTNISLLVRSTRGNEPNNWTNCNLLIIPDIWYTLKRTAESLVDLHIKMMSALSNETMYIHFWHLTCKDQHH